MGEWNPIIAPEPKLWKELNTKHILPQRHQMQSKSGEDVDCFSANTVGKNETKNLNQT